jgi:Cu(I)/Ag(I) efflux system membrane fusion protein
MERRASAAPVLLVAAALACGDSRSAPVEVESGDLSVRAAVEPDGLRVGENVLWLELRDAQGRPVRAQVDVAVRMHAMGTMPAMGGPARVRELGDGRYRADFDLEMGGTWQLEIEARAESGRTAEAEGSLSVGTKGLRLEAVGAAAAPSAAESEAAGGGSAGQAGHAGHGGLAAPPAGAAAGEHPGEFAMESARVQRIGVRSGVAERKRLESDVRAVGRVAWDETALADVSLKVGGWVEELRVDAVGDAVQRGDVLFTLYSPELYAAQRELLEALRSREHAAVTGASERAGRLAAAARKRLLLWDVAPADVDRMAATGRALEQVPIRSPASGYVVEKEVVAGSAVSAGERLYRIAPLDRVWVEAEVYEAELPLVSEGQRATVTLPYLPGRGFEGRVAWIYPSLSGETRTAKLRIELANPEHELRPMMFANVRLHVDRGERLVVPLSAVLFAGERSFVFLDLGEGRFRPQRVEVGLRGGEEVEILSGLEAGARIVTSGTFLIASESRLRAALEQW